MAKTPRKSISAEITARVLLRSRRRCCLCYLLNGDLDQHGGQIAHIDRNPLNPSEDNLAFMCLRHHDEYDSRPSQSKGFTPDELRHARDRLYEVLPHADDVLFCATLQLQRDLDEFTKREEKKFIDLLRKVLKSGGDLEVHNKRKGSVLLDLHLRGEEIVRLAQAIDSGALAHLGATIELMLPIEDERSHSNLDMSSQRVDTHLYLSLIPESLVVSMLPPEEFGSYLVVGTKKRAREQAIYFEINDFESDYFDIQGAIERCKPHEDGKPKHSVYVSTYRVLEHVPLKAIGSLWLVTSNGLSLELKQGPLSAESDTAHHLYQELCPIHPLIASSLSPPEFSKFITDPNMGVSVPKICFLELEPGVPYVAAEKPERCNLPYKNSKHLWDCMRQLTERDKLAKTVDWIHPPHVLYRCTKSGFYIGDQDTVLYYPFPSPEELETEHHRWWRWAQLS